MTTVAAPRRLAAILSADAVGYSRLIGVDEEGTRRLFNTLFDRAFVPAIDTHHGRVVKTMGDGILAEFSSAVDAVRCAVAFQTALADSNDAAPDEKKMHFRVGVNLGDVLVEGDDIHGDGVNVAARLEALADPGDILVSGIVYEIVQAKVPYGFDDLGQQPVKNIADGVRVFRLHTGEVTTEAPVESTGVAPDRPSLVVLPFANNSEDPEQEYFADGISEDLMTDLASMNDLFVVSRNSSFAFKGQSLDAREVCRQLGVAHALEGSVRRSGDRIRINARLVDGKTGGQLWAERFDGDLSDVFDLQDDINSRIVSALRTTLPIAEKRAEIRQVPRNSQAYDLCLKGRWEYYFYTPDRLAKAGEYFQRAIEEDAEYAEAFAYLSYCRAATYVFTWPGADDTLAPALALAEKAVQLNPSSAVVHARLGWVLGFIDRFEDAISSFERAIEIDPRNAEAYYAYGETMNRAGDPGRALPILEKAFSIDTFVPPGWEFAKGHSYVLLRRYEEALDYMLPVIDRLPQFVPARVQIARAYTEMGRVDDAKASVRAVLEIAPRYSIGSSRRMFPYPNGEERARLTEALLAAGLPGD
jgi:adenylate cyclase